MTTALAARLPVGGASSVACGRKLHQRVRRCGLRDARLADCVREAVVLVVIFSAGLISGMRIDGSIGDLLALVVLALAVSATSTLWAAGIAMRLRTMQAGPVMQMPIFILLFLAPVYVPLSLVQGWVHEVARFNPFTGMLEAARGFVSGEPDKVAISAACIVVLFTLTVAWARGGLRSAERAG